jgi:transcriptional regulator with XRE-family HTH domain
VIPVDTVEDLGEVLRLIRQLRGMSQVDVDARSGVCFTRISRYERAQSVPDCRTLMRVLAALGHRLAIVPLIGTAQETALSASMADREGQMHTRVGVDGSDGATGLSGGAA